MSQCIRMLTVMVLSVCSLFAQRIEPTFSAVPYGDYERNTLDFWKAEGDTPRPLLIYIHGGAWTGNDKTQIYGRVPIQKWLDKGVSVASIDYRLSTDAVLPAPVHDAARAIQFIRNNAEAYNVKTDHIALQGGSAGGCSSLWILLHDDLADPDSENPVLRQSTRVSGAYTQSAQTTIDPYVMEEWIGISAAANMMICKSVGEPNLNSLKQNYRRHRDLIEEFSPINHLDAEDPPLYMSYRTLSPPENGAQAIHHGNFGVKLKEKSDELGHESYLCIEDQQADCVYKNGNEFLDAVLLGQEEE